MYLTLLRELGIKVEQVVTDTTSDPLVIKAAQSLFANRCEWGWLSDYQLLIRRNYPTLARYYGYRFKRKRRRIQSTVRHLEISLNPGWGFPDQIPNHDRLLETIFTNQISVTAACLLYALEAAPRYRENSGLDAFRSHIIPSSLHESIQLYT